MTERENYLRAIEYRHPEWIPCAVNLSLAARRKHGERLKELTERHPLIFPDHLREVLWADEELPPTHRYGEYWTDPWGCVWHNIQEGLQGQVVVHPLADWSAFESYVPPDPRAPIEQGGTDWTQVKKDMHERQAQGRVARGWGDSLFDRLYFLRGFENLMLDFGTEDPRLPRLVDMLLDYEMKLLDCWLQIKPDSIYFHTDIGAQHGLMISPEQFRRRIKPMFKEIFTACRDGGIHVYLSSDGHVLEIVDDLVECRVSMHDPQLRANGLDGIVQAYKGKMCVNLDLDRQMFPFCTPEDIRRQVKEAVEKLATREGGLMIFGAIHGGDVPVANIEALCTAFEAYCLKN